MHHLVSCIREWDYPHNKKKFDIYRAALSSHRRFVETGMNFMQAKEWQLALSKVWCNFQHSRNPVDCVSVLPKIDQIHCEQVQTEECNSPHFTRSHGGCMVFSTGYPHSSKTSMAWRSLTLPPTHCCHMLFKEGSALLAGCLQVRVRVLEGAGLVACRRGRG